MEVHHGELPSRDPVWGAQITDSPLLLHLPSGICCSIPAEAPFCPGHSHPMTQHKNTWHRTSLMDSLCSGLPIGLVETFPELHCVCGPSQPFTHTSFLPSFSQGSDLHLGPKAHPTYSCPPPLSFSVSLQVSLFFITPIF